MYEASLLKSPLPILSFRHSVLAQMGWAVIFLLPLCLWHYTSDVYSYYRYGAPVGQIWYVFSKLFGLYAALFLWFQVVSSVLSITSYRVGLPQWTLLRHQYLGCIVFVSMVLHIAFFVIAVSLRKEAFAWFLLLPNISDFYHAVITVGLLAFVMALLAVLSAVLRKKMPQFWRYLHRAMMFVVALGLIHGFLIGTETRYGLYKGFYCMLIVTFLAAFFLRLREKKRHIV